jgi:plastocyanin
MKTGTALANKVVIALLTMILAALGVVIYQNSHQPSGSPKVRTAQVEAEKSEALPEPATVEQVEPVSPTPVAPPKPVLGRRPAPPVLRMISATAPAAPSNLQVVQASADAPDLTPVPILVPGVSIASGGIVSGADGEITGRILLSGRPPAEIPIQMDATCGRFQSEPVSTRHYVVNSDGALANVFVYIKAGLEQVSFTVPQETPLIDNANCLFEPYVLGVQTGQTFRVRNSDSVLHNFHMTTRINPERNLALPLKGQTISLRLDKPEVLTRVKCDVHPWMFAYIGVASHPFFSVSDTNGVFKLPSGLPEGTYTLAAYHQKAGELTREITVRHGQKQSLDLMFTVPSQLTRK